MGTQKPTRGQLNTTVKVNKKGPMVGKIGPKKKRQKNLAPPRTQAPRGETTNQGMFFFLEMETEATD